MTTVSQNWSVTHNQRAWILREYLYYAIEFCVVSITVSVINDVNFEIPWDSKRYKKSDCTVRQIIILHSKLLKFSFMNKFQGRKLKSCCLLFLLSQHSFGPIYNLE